MSKKRKLSKGVRQWLNYLKKGTNAEEWDWGFMLEMEREKLKRMANWFEENGCHEGVENQVSKMRLAVNLLNIILDTQENIPYVNTQNIQRFVSKNELTYLEECLIESSVTINLTSTTDPIGSMPFTFDRGKIALREIRDAKAWYLYSKLRYYFLKRWWD